jgi:hypothetical protein
MGNPTFGWCESDTLYVQYTYEGGKWKLLEQEGSLYAREDATDGSLEDGLHKVLGLWLDSCRNKPEVLHVCTEAGEQFQVTPTAPYELSRGDGRRALGKGKLETYATLDALHYRLWHDLPHEPVQAVGVDF